MTDSPYTYRLHETEISDPYYWLEDLDSPRTRAWIDAQNERTFAYLDAIPERAGIRRRITALWNYERCGAPFKEGGRYFFLKNDGLQNQSVLYVMDAAGAAPRVLLDPNTLSPDGIIALTGTQVSRDGKLLAYGLSRAGSDWEEWRVRDVDTAEDLPDVLRWVKFSAASWTPDGKGFFYSRYDEPKSGEEYEGRNFFHKVCYHRIGTPQSSDRIVYERPDHKDWNFYAGVSRDGRYFVLHVWAASDHNLLFYQDLHNSGPLVELISEFNGRYHFIDNSGPVFLLLTDFEASRGRVVAIDTVNPACCQWSELIPEADDTLDRVSCAGDYLIASYLADARSEIRVFDRAGRFVRDVELPGIGTAGAFSGQPGDAETFFEFTGFTLPQTVFRYDAASGVRSVFHAPPLLFDPADFETRQIFYESKDGTRIPMFLIHRRGLVPDGSHPTELYGYGGFNISITPSFSVARIAWMEMGGVVAVPNIRGGGEYGEDWHLAGTKAAKQNVFDDFIAAAEWLIANEYTSPARLAITGRSNGGLLVGACMVQRPDLFGAAIPGVGVMDMLRFHQFTIGWSWVSDYGSPDDPKEFPALYAYSPYHNIRPDESYPATLVTTGDHDDRVVPAHSYKFSAALQAAQAGSAPILIRIDVQAGHGAGKPVSKQIDEVTDVVSFLVQVFGMNLRAVAAD